MDPTDQPLADLLAQPLVTERDVANSLNAPKNVAQRIYYPLLARKMFFSMAGQRGDGDAFRQGTPARRHKNVRFTDDGEAITRGERKRAARAVTVATIEVEQANAAERRRAFQKLRYGKAA